MTSNAKHLLGILKIAVLDAQFEENIDKSQIGIYFIHGKRLAEVMVIGERSHAKFHVARGNTQDKLVISAKNLQTEERHGSVSFFLESYFSSLSQDIEVGRVYRHWVTLFDHPDDDIYDGVIGEDDDEIPRIYLEIIVEEAKRDLTPNKRGVVEDTPK